MTLKGVVLKPPRDRPITWSSPTFLYAGAVLMGAHEGAVGHGVLVVGLTREVLGRHGATPDCGARIRLIAPGTGAA